MSDDHPGFVPVDEPLDMDIPADEPTSREWVGGKLPPNPLTAAQQLAGARGVMIGSWPPGWGAGEYVQPPLSDHDMRDIRERAMGHAAYVAPEMTEFVDFDAYMARLTKTADRIADWIKDGV